MMKYSLHRLIYSKEAFKLVLHLAMFSDQLDLDDKDVTENIKV